MRSPRPVAAIGGLSLIRKPKENCDECFEDRSQICSAVLAIGLCSASAAEEASTAADAEVSRAEVLADMVIWRESGLAQAQSGEAASDPSSPNYLAALSRYHTLRAAPQFAQLVQRIARERGEKAQIAAQR